MNPLADVVAPENVEGTKATVLRWCKSPGDSIRKDEPLLELETDKVTVEVPSPVTGELAEILKQPNEEVLPGQLLARVRTAAPESRESEPASPAAPPTPSPTLSIRPAARAASPPAQAASAGDVAQVLSPAVRRLLREHSLAASDIAGSGASGRVTAQDVERHLEEHATETSRAAADADTRPLPALIEGETSARLPHTPMRRKVAEHMARSLAQAPHVTTLFEADLTRVEEHRALHGAEFERQGARLTLTAYFVAACASALKAHPEVNATFHEDARELHSDANIGVGTALGNEGLIVPVIRKAQGMKLAEIARRLGELVAAARSGKLTPQDVHGGTFTISNHGVGGSLLAAPIVINQPQVAILGVGKVERRVCVLESAGGEAIGVRTKCYLTLTIDHRALDAFQANGFLTHVVKTLEQWPES